MDVLAQYGVRADPQSQLSASGTAASQSARGDTRGWVRPGQSPGAGCTTREIPGGCWFFDNYNEPNQLNIGNYCPDAGHRPIVVTTRLPDLIRGHQVRVQLLDDIEESLTILQTRSRRDHVRQRKFK